MNYRGLLQSQVILIAVMTMLSGFVHGSPDSLRNGSEEVYYNNNNLKKLMTTTSTRNNNIDNKNDSNKDDNIIVGKNRRLLENEVTLVGGDSCEVGTALNTTYPGDRVAAGTMFTVRPKQDLEVLSMEFDSFAYTGAYDVYVYYKPGEFMDFMSDATSWTQLAQSTAVPAPEQNSGLIIPARDFQPVQLTANQIYSFYVSLQTQHFRVSSLQLKTGQLWASDDMLDVHVGVGLRRYPFPTEADPDRNFHGLIHYRTLTTCSSLVQTTKLDLTYAIHADSDPRTFNIAFTSFMESMLVKNSQLQQFVDIHQLQIVRISSSFRRGTGRNDENCPDTFERCQYIDFIVPMNHLPTLSSGLLTMSFLQIVIDNKETINFDRGNHNAIYIGDPLVQGQFTLILHGAPSLTALDPIVQRYLEDIIKQFLQAFSIDQVLNANVAINADDNNQNRRRKLRTRHLQNSMSNLNIVATISGTSMDNSTFINNIQTVFTDRNDILTSRLAVKHLRPSEIGNSDMGSFFSDVTTVTATQYVPPSNIDNTNNTGVAGSQGDGTNVAIIIIACTVVFLLGGLFLGYRYYSRKNATKSQSKDRHIDIQTPPTDLAEASHIDATSEIEVSDDKNNAIDKDQDGTNDAMNNDGPKKQNSAALQKHDRATTIKKKKKSIVQVNEQALPKSSEVYTESQSEIDCRPRQSQQKNSTSVKRTSKPNSSLKVKSTTKSEGISRPLSESCTDGQAPPESAQIPRKTSITKSAQQKAKPTTQSGTQPKRRSSKQMKSGDQISMSSLSRTSSTNTAGGEGDIIVEVNENAIEVSEIEPLSRSSSGRTIQKQSSKSSMLQRDRVAKHINPTVKTTTIKKRPSTRRKTSLNSVGSSSDHSKQSSVGGGGSSHKPRSQSSDISTKQDSSQSPTKSIQSTSKSFDEDNDLSKKSDGIEQAKVIDKAQPQATTSQHNEIRQPLHELSSTPSDSIPINSAKSSKNDENTQSLPSNRLYSSGVPTSPSPNSNVRVGKDPSPKSRNRSGILGRGLNQSKSMPPTLVSPARAKKRAIEALLRRGTDNIDAILSPRTTLSENDRDASRFKGHEKLIEKLPGCICPPLEVKVSSPISSPISSDKAHNDVVKAATSSSLTREKNSQQETTSIDNKRSDSARTIDQLLALKVPALTKKSNNGKNGTSRSRNSSKRDLSSSSSSLTSDPTKNIDETSSTERGSGEETKQTVGNGSMTTPQLPGKNTITRMPSNNHDAVKPPVSPKKPQQEENIASMDKATKPKSEKSTKAGGAGSGSGGSSSPSLSKKKKKQSTRGRSMSPAPMIVGLDDAVPGSKTRKKSRSRSRGVRRNRSLPMNPVLRQGSFNTQNPYGQGTLPAYLDTSHHSRSGKKPKKTSRSKSPKRKLTGQSPKKAGKAATTPESDGPIGFVVSDPAYSSKSKFEKG